MKTIIVLQITMCTTGFDQVGSAAENSYIVGLGRVNSILGWVGLGLVNWTLVHLCV